jgi:hypothetical protein
VSFVFSRSKIDVVERRDGNVYFWYAREGQGFRVYDVAIEGGLRVVPYESRNATHRVFVAVVGHQWRYAFGNNDLRSITAGELARQRAAAVFHPGKHQHGDRPRG